VILEPDGMTHFVVDADPEWGLVDPAAGAWSTQQISLAEPPLD
jgi:hypothetical protein